jgi:hypothetical protein
VRRSHSRSVARLAVLLAAGVLASGCGGNVVRRSVERRVERRLTSVLGPADEYQVHIRDTPNAELVQGRARQVEISATRIHAREQFEVERLHLTLSDLRYDGSEPYFVSVRRSDLELEFTEAAVNGYLTKFQARYAPTVRFEADRVRVSLVYPFLGKPTPIQATGHFTIQEGRRLLFVAESADLSFLNRPGFGEKFVEDRVNPLLDLRRVGFPARLESVQVLPGRLRARGTAAILGDESE